MSRWGHGARHAAAVQAATPGRHAPGRSVSAAKAAAAGRIQASRRSAGARRGREERGHGRRVTVSSLSPPRPPASIVTGVYHDAARVDAMGDAPALLLRSPLIGGAGMGGRADGTGDRWQAGTITSEWHGRIESGQSLTRYAVAGSFTPLRALALARRAGGGSARERSFWPGPMNQG
jgi:hypothetical protein